MCLIRVLEEDSSTHLKGFNWGGGKGVIGGKKSRIDKKLSQLLVNSTLLTSTLPPFLSIQSDLKANTHIMKNYGR